MANNLIKRKTNLDSTVKVEDLGGFLYTGESQAHVFEIECYQQGSKISLGGTVSGKFIRANGTTAPVVGTIIDGKAVAALSPACYAIPGRYQLTIFNTSGSDTVCVYSAVGTVNISETSTIIDPGTIIPDINTLIAEIEAAVASIPADYSALWETIAPAFSSSVEYVAGQYVTYDGGMYRFKNAHSGTWSVADVVSVSVGGDLTGLDKKIKGLQDIVTTEIATGATFDTIETGKAYNATNTGGTAWSGANSYIKAVTSGEKYEITTTVIANAQYYAVLYYTGTTYVSGEVQGIAGEQQQIVNHEFTIPENINKIIVCTYAAVTPVLYKMVLSPYADISVGEAIQNYAVYDGTTLSVKMRYNASEDLVVQMKKRGNNSLFDFDKIFTTVRADVLDGDIVPVRNILTANTDCFSPHQVRAKNNADGDSSDIFLTGGNHNHDSVPTATCQNVKVYFDGKLSANFSGLVSHVRVTWTNLIQGHNTWKANGTGRAILQEDITLDINGNVFSVCVSQKALEDIYQSVYYGLQSINTPYETILFIGGENRSMCAINTNRNSGNLKARRTLAVNTTTGDALETYVANEDLGAFELTGSTYSIFTANNKCYYAVLRDQSVEMASGNIYDLFGHYAFISNTQ